MDHLLFRSFTIRVAPCSCQCNFLWPKHLLALLIGGVLPPARCQADLTLRHSASAERADKCAKAWHRGRYRGQGSMWRRLCKQNVNGLPRLLCCPVCRVCHQRSPLILPCFFPFLHLSSATVLFPRAQDPPAPSSNSTEGAGNFQIVCT